MNQDFGLSLTPANARRLLLFQETFNIELPDDLKSLAEQNRISAGDFDPFVPDASCLTVAQFLLDCKLRGLVQQKFNPSFNEVALLQTICLGNTDRITIIADSLAEALWLRAIKHLHLSKDIEIHPQLSDDLADHRRDGVVIYAVDDNKRNIINRTIHNYAREFPQFIIFESSLAFTLPWPLWASLLFPTMPTPLYARIVAQVPMDWSHIPLYKFAPFYNVCLFPQYIATCDISLLQDSQMNAQLEQLVSFFE